jgi:hypothetical protein
MKIELEPMPPHPGRVPLMFRSRAFWLFAALNLFGIAVSVWAAHLDATTDNDLLLALMCVNLAVQLGTTARIVRGARQAFRDHREMLASWERLRQFREHIETTLQ